MFSLCLSRRFLFLFQLCDFYFVFFSFILLFEVFFHFIFFMCESSLFFVVWIFLCLVMRIFYFCRIDFLSLPLFLPSLNLPSPSFSLSIYPLTFLNISLPTSYLPLTLHPIIFSSLFLLLSPPPTFLKQEFRMQKMDICPEKRTIKTTTLDMT